MTQSLSSRVLKWFDLHGRKDLPWQQNPTPYRVWISEIMLQQTQVATVIPYYQHFMSSFPDVNTLAHAEEDLVLQHWAGLGYYSRARNLHKAAKLVCDKFAGVIPEDIDQVQSLPGIGRSTAGAILSLAYQQQQAILDGNVKRVLTRHHAVEGWTGKSQVLKQLWSLAESHLPSKRHADYTQAMMDLGATVCSRTKPDCEQCPLRSSCAALAEGNPTAYPTPKPKKIIPDKNTVMLMLINHKDEIFVMKRPSTGIWGGLWSFPQFDDYEQAQAWHEDHFNAPLESAEKNAEKETRLTHTFSHFRLHIHALLIRQTPPIKGVMEGTPSLWYNRGTKFTGGFPAPIEKLLSRILT